MQFRYPASGMKCDWLASNLGFSKPFGGAFRRLSLASALKWLAAAFPAWQVHERRTALGAKCFGFPRSPK
jgi:hypothetical protein